MKPKQINISIPEPCSEDWDKMLPEEKGRFCMSCQKVVVDFTTMSDEQLLKYFTEYKGKNTCGHFLATQVDRPLAIPQKRHWYSNINKRVAAAFIAVQAILFNVRTYAMPQSNIEIVDGTQAQGDKVTAITGRVVDYLTKEPVVGVKVIIEGTDYYAITDIKGGFAISVKESALSGMLKVSVVENTNDDSSTYWSEEGTIAELANKNFTIYKYPQGVMKDVSVTSYRMGMSIDHDVRTYGGLPSITYTKIVPIRNSFWRRLIHPFRKKNK